MKIKEAGNGEVHVALSSKEFRVLFVLGFLPLYAEVVAAERQMRDANLTPCNQPDCDDCNYRDLVTSMGKTVDEYMFELAKKIVNDPRVPEGLAKAVIGLVEKQKEERDGR